MKSSLIIFLILSFFGIAVFGSFSMIYGDTHNGGCIASNPAMGGSTACPLNNPLIFLVFHLDVFKYFSTAIIAVLLVLLVSVFFSILPRPLNDEEDDDDFVLRTQGGLFRIPPKIREIYHWLSIHIKSPSFVATAAI